MATFLIDLSPSDMQRRLGDALAVYVDAMRYPRGTEDQRASMWLEHTQRGGWKAVAAVEGPDQAGSDGSLSPELASAPLLGIAYGYCGAPDQWWQQQVVAGLRLAEGEWEVLRCETHDRLQNGPDGVPAHRTDSTIKLRRVRR